MREFGQLIIDIYLKKDSKINAYLTDVLKDISDIKMSVNHYDTIPDGEKQEHSLLIFEDVSELLANPAIYLMSYDYLVFFGNEGDLTELDDEILSMISGIWSSSCPERIMRHKIRDFLLKLLSQYGYLLYKDLLRFCMNNNQDMVWFKDLKGRYMMVNDQFVNIVGRPREEIIGANHDSIWSGSYTTVNLDTDKAAIEAGALSTFEETVESSTKKMQLRTFKSPVYDLDGEPIGTVGSGHDITDITNLGSQLNILMENLPLPFALCDVNWKLLHTNNSFNQTFGFTPLIDFASNYADWKMHTFKETIKKHSSNAGHKELILHDDCGETNVFTLIEQPILNFFGEPCGYYCLFLDISKERAFENEVVTMANTDFMTKLYNRRYFYQYLNNHIGVPLTLLYFDIDRFKQINDTYGHSMGDFVLITVAEMIREHFPEGMSARMGGDEFTVIIKGELPEDEAYARCKKMQDQIYEVLHKEVGELSVSMGVSHSDGSDTNTDDLISKSDEKMYKQKQISHKRTGYKGRE